MDFAAASDSKHRKQSLFSDHKEHGSYSDDDDAYDEEGFRKLRFKKFTKSSYEKLLLREAEDKKEAAERKDKAQEAHLKDGELKFGMEFYDGMRPDRNPDLEEGQTLRTNYGVPPLKLLGVPLEEVDHGIPNKTFVVFSRRLHKIYITRFSATPSFFIFSAWNPIRTWAVAFYTHQIFDFFILFTIMVNCILLAIDVEDLDPSIEITFFAIYLVEMLTKMMARGLFGASYTYLRDPWNWLDLVVVISGIPPLIIAEVPDIETPNYNLGPLQALRSFRVLRAVKTISIFPGLKTIVSAMLRAMRMLGEVVMLTVFCLLVFALVSVHFYKGTLRQKCVRNPSTLQHLKKPYESYHYFYHRITHDKSK